MSQQIYLIKSRYVIFCLSLLAVVQGCGVQGTGLTSSGNGQSDLGPSLATKETEDGSGFGNGGGVIRREGKVLTLVQAGITIPLTEVEEPKLDLPALAVIEDLVRRLAVTDYYKSALFNALRPAASRKYFKIGAEDLSPEKRKLLLAQYESVIGQKLPNGDEVTLCAVTIGKETFLLPEFYELSDDMARASILLHEALWVIDPRQLLSRVLQAEMATESLLRRENASGVREPVVYDTQILRAYGAAVGNPELELAGFFMEKFSHGPITLHYPSGNEVTHVRAIFTLAQLLGDDTIHYSNVNRDLLSYSVEKYWREMASLNPRCGIFPKLLEYVDRVRWFGLNINYSGREPALVNYGEMDGRNQVDFSELGSGRILTIYRKGDSYSKWFDPPAEYSPFRLEDDVSCRIPGYFLGEGVLVFHSAACYPAKGQ